MQEKIKVLLVEQDAGLARYVEEMLGLGRDLRAELLHAGDLAQGSAALRTDHFDVVLLDLAIPDGAGLANLPLLREIAPQVPLIVVGNSEDQILAMEVVQAGAHDYLVKRQLSPTWLERSLRYAVERHHMDNALVKTEEKFHNIFDHLVEGIFQTTPEGQYLLANAALARIYGYASPEELMDNLTDIGRRLYVQPGRRDEFVRTMQEHDTLAGFESEIFRKDNSKIWISENCRAIRDKKGKLLYYEGTVEDITQRRHAEEKLRNSEALYHSLVETLPQNIFRKDLQCRFTFANQQMCQTLGRSLEEIVGKTDFDFFPRALADKYQVDDHQVMATGKPFETVEEHQPPSGSKIFVHVVKTPIYRADGQILGLQGIFWDITQQRLAEDRIRRANAALAQSRQELHAKNIQMEDDLKMAREIQLTILPQQYPVFPRPGSTESAFEFTHRYLPTGSVGGDFFTISAISDTQAGVFLCDVAGHGVRSALVTTMIRALVEELKALAIDPGEFLTKLNRDLCTILRHTGTPLLTTAFYLVADWQRGVMRYANAGHPKPLHVRRRAGQVLPLSNASGKSQPAMGLMEDAKYLATEILLSPEDLILLFTDGLVEVQSPKAELYSPSLLLKAVQQRLQLPAPLLFDELLEEIRAFGHNAEFTDDVCLVGMEVARQIA